MGQYPWGFTGVTPNASDNLPDKGSYDGHEPGLHRRRRAARRPDAPLRGAGRHVADAGLAARSATQFWGPQPGHRCTGTEPGAPADPKPSQCDDGPFGNGTGGELTYTLSLPAGGSKTVWLARRRLRRGPGAGAAGAGQPLKDPAAALAAKVAVPPAARAA